MPRVIDTGLLPIWSGKGTTDASAVFVPLTDALDTTTVRKARISRNLESDSGLCSVRRAYNMSDDGVTWSTTITAIGSFDATGGWAYDESAATQVTTNQRRRVRFGVEVKNESGAKVERALGQLRIELTPVSGRTLKAGPQQVWSDGTTTYSFHAMTEAYPIQDIEEIRGSVELSGDSGDAVIIPAYQLSNDGVTWEAAESFGTAQDGNGVTWGTSFTTFAPASTKMFVRFGVACKNGTAGKIENCLATLTIDFRLA